MNAPTETHTPASGDPPSSGNSSLPRIVAMFFILNGMYAFSSVALGPLMPTMSQELGFSYQIAAFHFSALSIGVITAGALGERVLHALTRNKSLWLGALGICIGLSLLISGSNFYVTISGAFLMGALGGIMGQCIDTVVAESYPFRTATIFTATNVICSLAATSAPSAIGWSLNTSTGWRFPLTLIILGYGLAFLTLHRVRLPEGAQAERKLAKGALPSSYWLYWFVILFSCASEWSVADWSADFLEKAVHLQRANAATAVSAFFGAMLAARIVGTFISSKVSLSKFLPVAMVVAFIGFMTFWLGQHWMVNIFGLFLAGAGIANLYPLVLSAALKTCPDITELGASRMNVATGLAGLLGPLTLGCLASRVGIFNAYGVVAILLLSALIMIYIANRFAKT